MLILAFVLSLSALILQAVLSPPFTLLPFAPWIALVTLFCPLPKALWLSALGGAVLDCLSDDPIGTHALSDLLAAALLFRFRKHFFYDRPLHLALFSTAVSFLCTPLQWILLFLFDRRVPFSGQWALVDLLCMPLADGLLALLWFAGPLLVFQHGSVYWQKIKANLFPPHA